MTVVLFLFTKQFVFVEPKVVDADWIEFKKNADCPVEKYCKSGNCVDKEGPCE